MVSTPGVCRGFFFSLSLLLSYNINACARYAEIYIYNRLHKTHAYNILVIVSLTLIRIHRSCLTFLLSFSLCFLMYNCAFVIVLEHRSFCFIFLSFLYDYSKKKITLRDNYFLFSFNSLYIIHPNGGKGGSVARRTHARTSYIIVI